MSRWHEVGDGVFQRRYDPLDVSVCVVRGAGGLLLVDTRSSHREADEIQADLRVFGHLPVRWVVNTHAHYDHCFGNARFGPDRPPTRRSTGTAGWWRTSPPTSSRCSTTGSRAASSRWMTGELW